MNIVLHNGRVLENAEQRLDDYFARWLHYYYSYDAVASEQPDVISEQDGHLANRLMARMSLRVWQPLVGRSIEPIGKDWDLFRVPDRDWTHQKQVTAHVLGPMLQSHGIAVANLTKGLHRKKPAFLPICDSFVRDILNVPGEKDVSVLLQCMEKLKDIGHRNFPILHHLRQGLISRGRDLTELRILDALLWAEVRNN